MLRSSSDQMEYLRQLTLHVIYNKKPKTMNLIRHHAKPLPSPHFLPTKERQTLHDAKVIVVSHKITSIFQDMNCKLQLQNNLKNGFKNCTFLTSNHPAP